ncbi:MAG: RraA family protein [Burkholderiaceae bacterium]
MFTQERRNEIRKRFETVDTANVADVLDTLGYMDCGLSQEFMPFPANGARLAGWAYTIRGQMSPFPLGGDAKKMEACNGISEGEISVWSGDGKGICYFGELIALGMRERGSVGALVDGGIRDVRWIGEHGIAVYARYRTPVQSIGRWMVTDYQVPVYVRGATSSYVRVRPGDFILADEDGAILIPVEVVEKVLEEAERLTATEVQIRAELAKGLTLAQALQKYGHV